MRAYSFQLLACHQKTTCEYTNLNSCWGVFIDIFLPIIAIREDWFPIIVWLFLGIVRLSSSCSPVAQEREKSDKERSKSSFPFCEESIATKRRLLNLLARIPVILLMSRTLSCLVATTQQATAWQWHWPDILLGASRSVVCIYNNTVCATIVTETLTCRWLWLMTIERPCGGRKMGSPLKKVCLWQTKFV